jgi:Fe-S oxidoreductase
MLFEEFLTTRATTLALASGPRTILLHGHCHQKAMGLLTPAKTLLSRIPNTTVVDLDAGCCGMAGSFGYAHEHYEVSRAIGERKLFPAVRSKGPDDVVVAAGTSCRHQIHDFTGETAMHPATLLRSLLRA